MTGRVLTHSSIRLKIAILQYDTDGNAYGMEWGAKANGGWLTALWLQRLSLPRKRYRRNSGDSAPITRD